MTGLIIAAPSSGAGKTTVTLALLRLLSRHGIPVRGAKSGPDYIDPAFHTAACGKPCMNLDAWAMSPQRITSLTAGDDTLIIEGAMGLFDGAPPDGRGAVADLARLLRMPVILVVDAGRMSQSVAPLCMGFANHDPNVCIAGVILNNVASPRHEAMLRRALEPTGLTLLATLPRSGDLRMPSRHLGLVQAQERGDLDDFLNRAADWLAPRIDLRAIMAIAQAAPFGAPTLPANAATGQPRTATHAPTPRAQPTPTSALGLPPPAQTIAIAQDCAFAFAYPHMLADWRRAGAEIRFFSPLADDPVPDAGFVFLPGGYPELHAERIAAASRFMTSLRTAAETTPIYGECGGYMVLGQRLVDADGRSHAMAGLLSLETSFETRRLHLGYRRLTALGGPFPGQVTGHEFHYATTLRASGDPLFAAKDAENTDLGQIGLRQGVVSGSFAHVIDRAPDT